LNQSWFRAMLSLLDYTVFYIVNHFHQSHLNQMHICHTLHGLHFNLHHFNQF
jgi:hypothetical protein